MKFLLAAVNAKYIHSNPAVYDLRAYCLKHEENWKENIELAEYTINQEAGEILRDIYKRSPDAAAFSCYIWNREMVMEVAGALRQVRPDLPVWVGGPEVSYDPEAVLLAYPFLKGVMVGEGEETFLELMRYYMKEAQEQARSKRLRRNEEKEPQPSGTQELRQIKGLVYREAGAIVHTDERQPIDIDELPFFYRDSGMEDFQNRIIYYESSRGCPYRCSYCLSSIDKRVRLREPEMVIQELQFFLDKDVPQVKFMDRTFNCSHEHALRIWRYIKEHDNGVTNFHFEISAELLNEEECALLRSMRPGLVQLEIGVQSTNPETLREIRRYSDPERLHEIVERIRQGRNIHIHLDLIAGLPYEGMESFQKSFDDVYRMRPQQLQLGFLKVLKGSYMYEKAEEYGIVYTGKPPYEVLLTNWLSFGDVLVLKRVEAMVELYYNSGQFGRTLPVLEQCFDSPFRLYERLAAYYEEQGFFINNPSRTYRYQILLSFAAFCDPRREEEYKALLLLDLYLRENLKSRPGFAPPLPDGEERERITAFFRQEEKEPKLLKEYAGCSAKQMMRMCHVEVFMHRYYVLFDYKTRNPLNGEARTLLICET